MNSYPTKTESKPTTPKPKNWKRFLGEPVRPITDAWETERQDFVCLPRLPAILTPVQAGWLLGFTDEAIGILVRDGLLVALGGAKPDDSKRFSSAYILQLSLNREWLDAATNAVYQSRAKVPGNEEISPINK